LFKMSDFCYPGVFVGEKVKNDISFLKFLGLGGRKSKIFRKFSKISELFKMSDFCYQGFSRARNSKMTEVF
jgi:hypothetical protein